MYIWLPHMCLVLQMLEAAVRFSGHYSRLELLLLMNKLGNLPRSTFFFFKILCVCFAYIYVCAPCTCHVCPLKSNLWGHKRMLGSLELELEMVISCHVHASNWTWISSSGRSTSALNYSPPQPSSPVMEALGWNFYKFRGVLLIHRPRFLGWLFHVSLTMER